HNGTTLPEIAETASDFSRIARTMHCDSTAILTEVAHGARRRGRRLGGGALPLLLASADASAAARRAGDWHQRFGPSAADAAGRASPTAAVSRRRATGDGRLASLHVGLQPRRCAAGTASR